LTVKGEKADSIAGVDAGDDDLAKPAGTVFLLKADR